MSDSMAAWIFVLTFLAYVGGKMDGAFSPLPLSSPSRNGLVLIGRLTWMGALIAQLVIILLHWKGV